MNGKIKTKFAALFAVALMITVCVVPVVGNEDVQAADVSSTIPEGISDIEIQLFTEDSKDFSDLIYCANGKGLPEGVDPVEWKEVALNTGVYINVNKNSEYFGKFLRFGQTGLSNEEIIKLGNDNTWLPLIQVSYMYSETDLDIVIDVTKDENKTINNKKISVAGSNTLNKADVEYSIAECVSTIKFIEANPTAGLQNDPSYMNFKANLAGATGEYEVDVKTGGTNGAVIASEKFSFESDADLLYVSGTVTDAESSPATPIKGAKVAYKINNAAGTVVTDDNGKYKIEFEPGSVVSITGITYGNGEYTFTGGYDFGTLDAKLSSAVDNNAGIKDFKANESTGSFTISAANSTGYIKGATVTLAWYYQYATTTTGTSPVKTYNISTAAPQGITAGKVSVLGPSDSSGTVKYTYIAPTGGLTTVGQTELAFMLINNNVPSAAGFTFKAVKLPVTSTDVYTDGSITTQAQSLSAQAINDNGVYTVYNSTEQSVNIIANENKGKITVDSKNDNSISGATVNLSWYYEYQTTSNNQITYNISTSAPQGVTAGTVKVLGASNDAGEIFYTYTVPSGSLTNVDQSNLEYVLINNSVPNATGYTFTQVTLPQTTTISTKALSAWNAGSYSTTTGTCNMSSGTGYLVAKENSYLIQGTVSAPGIVADSEGKVPELTVSYTNGIGSSVKVDVLTSGKYAYKFYAIEGKSCVITPTLNGYTFTPVSFTTNSAGADITVPEFVGESTAKVTDYNETSRDIGSVSVSGFASGDVTNKLVVDLTYDVDGKQYTTPVLVSEVTNDDQSKDYVASFGVAGIAGTYVQLVSASAENYQFSLNAQGKLVAGSSKIMNFYLYDGEPNVPAEGVELTIFDGNDNKLGIIKSDAKGIASLEIPNNVSQPYAIYDGLYKLTFDTTSSVKYTGYKCANVAGYIDDKDAIVKVTYVSAYNNETTSETIPLEYRAIAPGDSIGADIGDSIALKAPSIDNFEFVAWMVDGVVVSESADYTLKVDGSCNVVALYTAVHYEEPAEGLSMNVLVIGIVILILGVLAVAYGIISKKQ